MKLIVLLFLCTTILPQTKWLCQYIFNGKLVFPTPEQTQILNFTPKKWKYTLGYGHYCFLNIQNPTNLYKMTKKNFKIEF